MRHNAARRSTTTAGFAAPKPAMFSIVGDTECAYTDDDVFWQATALPLELQNVNWADWCYKEDVGYLAVGDANHFAVSELGRNWISTPAPVNGKTWVGCAYSPTLNLFIVVASDGVNYRSSSPTGPWTVGTVFSGLTMQAMEWLDDKFVALASLGTNRFQHSANGTSWTNIGESGVGNGANHGIKKLSTGRFLLGQNNGIRHTTNAALTGWTNVTISGAGNLKYLCETPVRTILYNGNTNVIRRILTASVGTPSSHNLPSGRVPVGRGHYRAENDVFYVNLNFAGDPTMHVQFYPGGSGVSFFYVSRGVGANGKIWCTPKG